MEQDEDTSQLELIQKFIQCIKQQELHTNLLPFQGAIYDELRELVQNQQQRLKQFLKYEDQQLKMNDKNFRYMLYNSQCDKLQYLLKMYLRTRLKKIQLYCFHYSKNIQEAQKLMSSVQLKFLKRYSQLRFAYYRDQVFKHFNRVYRDFKEIEVLFAKNQTQSREKKLFVQTNQSMIELKAPTGNDYVFAEVVGNSQHLRFGIDIAVSNLPSQNMEVISQGTTIFCPLKTIQQRFSVQEYRLI